MVMVVFGLFEELSRHRTERNVTMGKVLRKLNTLCVTEVVSKDRVQCFTEHQPRKATFWKRSVLASGRHADGSLTLRWRPGKKDGRWFRAFPCGHSRAGGLDVSGALGWGRPLFFGLARGIANTICKTLCPVDTLAERLRAIERYGAPGPCDVWLKPRASLKYPPARKGQRVCRAVDGHEVPPPNATVPGDTSKPSWSFRGLGLGDFRHCGRKILQRHWSFLKMLKFAAILMAFLKRMREASLPGILTNREPFPQPKCIFLLICHESRQPAG